MRNRYFDNEPQAEIELLTQCPQFLNGRMASPSVLSSSHDSLETFCERGAVEWAIIDAPSAEPPCVGDCALTKPAPEVDPQLARLLAARPSLSEPIKAAILALVKSAGTPSK